MRVYIIYVNKNDDVNIIHGTGTKFLKEIRCIGIFFENCSKKPMKGIFKDFIKMEGQSMKFITISISKGLAQWPKYPQRYWKWYITKNGRVDPHLKGNVFQKQTLKKW